MREAPYRPLMDLSSTAEYDLHGLLQSSPPPEVCSPSTHEASGSDLRRACLTRLCSAFRLFQPPDALLLPGPSRLCFTPVTPMGFALQRFSPLACRRDLPVRLPLLTLAAKNPPIPAVASRFPVTRNRSAPAPDPPSRPHAGASMLLGARRAWPEFRPSPMDGYEDPARPAASLGETVVATVLPSRTPPDGYPVRLPVRDTPVRWSSGSVAVLHPAAVETSIGARGPRVDASATRCASRRPVPAHGHRSLRIDRLASAWSDCSRAGVVPSCPSRAVRHPSHQNPQPRCRVLRSRSLRPPSHVPRVSDVSTPGRNRRRVGPHDTRHVGPASGRSEDRPSTDPGDEVANSPSGV